ncbi:MAG: hypothetical protein M3N18_06140 [Actinomycetota bacterium]|nr:hypothetical protein [Actinomycetota bacterium]
MRSHRVRTLQRHGPEKIVPANKTLLLVVGGTPTPTSFWPEITRGRIMIDRRLRALRAPEGGWRDRRVP